MNNHPYQTRSESYRGKNSWQRQSRLERMATTTSPQSTVEQKSSTAITEPSLLFSKSTPSVDIPGNVDSKMTLEYGDNNSENETNKQCDDLQSTSCTMSLSENAELYKGNGSPWTEETLKNHSKLQPGIESSVRVI